MTSTRHNGRSPMSMVSFFSWECSDQAESDMRSLGLFPTLADHQAANNTGHARLCAGHPRLFCRAHARALAGTEQGDAPLAFWSFWPQIGAGRLAVDEPLANRVRSGRKQP